MKEEAQLAALGPLDAQGPAISVNAAGDVAQTVGNVTTGTVTTGTVTMGNVTTGDVMTGTVMRVDPNTDEELIASLRLQVQQRDQFIRANG